jgi:putative tryptophan/tyrosine transport system substrate-binding protein
MLGLSPIKVLVLADTILSLWSLGAEMRRRQFISAVSQAQTLHLVAAFGRGLGETGYTDGRNVVIDYRFADGQYDRLPALAAEMVHRPVSLIMAAAPPAAIAAKVATTAIPIVFIVGLDPVGAGLAASFNRPGGNATGMVLISTLLKSGWNSCVISFPRQPSSRCWPIR